jgi:hypothetical protein
MYNMERQTRRTTTKRIDAMRTITTEKTVFTFEELSDTAKEKAREWYRNCDSGDNFFAESVIEDALQCAAILGIDIDKRGIQWSGFWSQGDGACFTGGYKYARGSAKKIREHAPNDGTLARIADELQAAQARHFYRLYAAVHTSGRYSHSGTMRVDVADSNDEYRDIGAAEHDIADALRNFADWIYQQLESAYEWTNADEQVDENILANEYEFTEDGKPA